MARVILGVPIDTVYNRNTTTGECARGRLIVAFISVVPEWHVCRAEALLLRTARRWRNTVMRSFIVMLLLTQSSQKAMVLTVVSEFLREYYYWEIRTT